MKNYVEFLIKGTRSNRFTTEDIGIIAPCHKQVLKIRKLWQQVVSNEKRFNVAMTRAQS